MKYAAKKAHKQAKDFVFKKSRAFIKDTTNLVIVKLQKEMVEVMKQQEIINQVIDEKDELIHKMNLKLVA